jgi:hypothetical protein
MTNKSTARDFFLHLLSTVLLYMGVISLIIVLFEIVNHYVPDVLARQYYNDPADEMRFSVAMLMISFPVFAWSIYYIKKLIQKDPAVKNFKVRKWLMYLTVFIAAIIIICTLISVVFNFLNGEFTTRFLLKVVAILLISLGMFWYYLIEVRDDQKKRSVQNIIAWSTVAVVVVIIVAAFFIMGSPSDQRAKRIDARRVEHLSAIFWEVNDYYRQNEILPESLAGFETRVVPDYLSLTDPETDEPYEYVVSGERTFKLCATFVTALEEGEGLEVGIFRPSKGFVNRSHPVGRHCYDLEVDDYIDDTILK